MSIFKKIARKVHKDLGVIYDMRPRSTGNDHGFTGRNEHGDPHLHAIHEDGKFKVYILTGEIKPEKGYSEPNAKLREIITEFIADYRRELLKMWKTQQFYLIKNNKKHKKRRK